MRNKKFWWIVVVLWCFAIYMFTASPVSTGSSTQAIIGSTINISDSASAILNLIVRKASHAIAFGLLTLFVLFALKGSRKSFILAWLFATLYGALDEIHQSFVPGRTAAVMDVGMDSFGALVTLVLAKLYIKLKGKEAV
ncbi:MULTISPECIES: VanZ family protein [unclassified Paenibacillus]|uniref:VanZ family protein n=1 Tax=unclassified Paenibacillus TaxID=185978 RepID=UPI001AE1A8DF|nr:MULTISPECIES: VanZ family protein [unclassified Paenibacillus]MBP1154374.1 VanZ family protein [Paenibacillus sp. PvP091]MBP1170242.1 VanZ family protein [Paenibacillus sp. PvR098]MBP2441270.1 VanZ family protein [Paenibacillus sp. PvP052]